MCLLLNHMAAVQQVAARNHTQANASAKTDCHATAQQRLAQRHACTMRTSARQHGNLKAM
jgi:hypothetical protein